MAVCPWWFGAARCLLMARNSLGLTSTCLIWLIWPALWVSVFFICQQQVLIASQISSGILTSFLLIQKLWPGKMSWLKQRLPGGSDGKESACNVRDPSLIPELGRSPGEENGYKLQYYCLENSIERRLAGSMGSPRVGHDWAINNFILSWGPWRHVARAPEAATFTFAA